jgi:hypothetical protein
VLSTVVIIKAEHTDCFDMIRIIVVVNSRVQQWIVFRINFNFPPFSFSPIIINIRKWMTIKKCFVLWLNADNQLI